jgi:hypothetical protein
MEAKAKTPNWKIIGAWTVVMVPFLWGIFQTLHSAMALIRR